VRQLLDVVTMGEGVVWKKLKLLYHTNMSRNFELTIYTNFQLGCSDLYYLIKLTFKQIYAHFK